MKTKLLTQMKVSAVLSLGVLLLSLVSMAQAQTYSSSNSEPIFRDSKGNMYISNGGSGVTPIYPVDSNIYSDAYLQPNIVQTIPNPNYTYSVPAPSPVYREPMYTSGVVYDAAPWLLLGGAAIAISNSNRSRYYAPRYNYRPPVYHGRPPIHRHGYRDGYRGHRGHR